MLKRFDPFPEMEMQIATNKKMYMIGHYHIAPHRNVVALRRSQTKSDKRVMNVFASEYGTPSVGAERNKKNWRALHP